MVSIELLAALDALLWLRTGERAAAYLQWTQSTVSRHSRRCLDVFGLMLEKQSGDWRLMGDQTLLDMERGVHQLLRWRQGFGLRLDSQHWCAHLLEPAVPPPWVPGNCNFLEYHQPLELVQRGVIDAWLCGAPDLPEYADLLAVQLTAMPLQLVVKPHHPLLDRGDALRFDDLADYPVLPLPDGAFPRTQAVLETLRLWACPERDRRVREASWLGARPVEDWMIAFETPLRLAAGLADDWQPLPLSLPLVVGEAVVVRREFAGFPPLQALVDGLCRRALELADGQPHVQVLWPDATRASAAGAQPGLNRSATPLLQ